ncbi:unnamed protein product [Symbiodinium pilosum]|uniref:Uncharacterized protein n=1 Tax=Symbiodinium pilosum TaxID=2952 RepID=A0A812T914_SYMPI|nr:unnamed protein product [Symbiodinium pilosum]
MLNSNLAVQLSQARARQQAQEASRLSSPFLQHLAYLFGPFSAVWALLWAARWRYSDAERLRELESKPGGAILLDLLAWRVTAHLGPYQVPNFSKSKMHEEPLRVLQDPLLLDYERMRALSRLGQLSQRHLAALGFSPPGGQPGSPLKAIEPILFEAFYEDPASQTQTPGTSSDTHRALAAKIILDVVAACPFEERCVPAWVLSGLVKAQGIPWQVGPQGEELRATLLCQLLRTPSNAAAAGSLREVREYLGGAGMKRKEDTIWPLKAYLLSGETHDLLRRGAKLVTKQCPGSIELQMRRKRDTPSLQTKRDLRNLWTSILLTAGWASFRHWTAVFTAQAVLQLAAGVGGAIAGTLVLEAVWSAEEQVIQSDWYWQDAYGSVPSAAMVVINCVALAWASRFSCILPFVACRLFKDDYLDAHRTFP